MFMLKVMNGAVIGALVAAGLVVLIPSGLAAPPAFWTQDNQGNQGDHGNFNIEISSSANPSTYGQRVTFTATVEPANNSGRVPVGRVVFKQDNTVLAIATLNNLGRATFSTNRFAATGFSCHLISVEYANDDNLQNTSTIFLIQKIIPATLTVTANNQSRPHGAANPPLTAGYSGFVNGETLTTSDVTGNPHLMTGATTNSAVGSYPVIISAGTLKSLNYKFVFVNGTLTVTSSTTTPNDPVQNVLMAQPQMQADKSVKLLLTGPASRTFVVEASSDLVHWTAISTNMTDANGRLSFTDTAAKNYPRRFYRGAIFQ
jgi:hypothetical protein